MRFPKWWKSKRPKLPSVARLTDKQIDECFERAWDDPEVAGIRTSYGDSQKAYFKRIITRRTKELNDAM